MRQAGRDLAPNVSPSLSKMLTEHLTQVPAGLKCGHPLGRAFAEFPSHGSRCRLCAAPPAQQPLCNHCKPNIILRNECANTQGSTRRHLSTGADYILFPTQAFKDGWHKDSSLLTTVEVCLVFFSPLEGQFLSFLSSVAICYSRDLCFSVAFS